MSVCVAVSVQGAELGIEFLARSDGTQKGCHLSRSDTGPVRLGLGFGRCQSGMRRCDVRRERFLDFRDRQRLRLHRGLGDNPLVVGMNFFANQRQFSVFCLFAEILRGTGLSGLGRSRQERDSLTCAPAGAATIAPTSNVAAISVAARPMVPSRCERFSMTWVLSPARLRS